MTYNKVQEKGSEFIFTAGQQALAFQKLGSTKGCLLFYLPRANRALHKDVNYTHMDGTNNGIGVLRVIIVITSANKIGTLDI